ncbi:purine permease [Sulfitobacter mediterraneus]|uniref:uracil-xanthine permease family protein n=1 Tax=Sulfitobacter mediterraneus TaxID=83219 RepID=UPI00193276FE|nr:nucleobase:cation symporter-2 family protein [Sulfitobacter mediterraneus]MBM1632622.1 purine permease [Sulfitobacter mediterraneus]MBM1641244.1 purine permease [Sulfitobacter mediterraneus]MBM1644487.1 purine permease [Sulfitobacter mediterraneus]MBM1649364.1 purine permease [Sulfitobacter mediterraneus]MBM1653385.1 purine permease [Sulfitobacter mediterraneus]
MTDTSSSVGYHDPSNTPPLGQAIPLGLQHVLAMFASNVTPSIIVAGAAGLAFGGPEQVYLIQMAMLFAGIATLFQTVGFGPVGARLPIMQGTSFAFVGVLAGVAATQGLGVALTACIIAGVIHFLLGSVIDKLRWLFPPLVTGLVILAIGLYLIPVAIKYAAGGAATFQMEAESFGSLMHWTVALSVVIVALALKFFTKGTLSNAAILVGLIVGYIVAYLSGMVSFGAVSKASWFTAIKPLPYGFEFSLGAVIAVTLVSIVSAIETVGDTSATTKAGAGREATDAEITGATYADGLGTAVAGVFGGLPNTSFSQNVGIVGMTGIMSRHVVTIGALVLILCGLVPKIGAVIASMPLPVLGGGVIVMFGMVAAAGLNVLSEINMNRRNMVIIAVALAAGLGLNLVPTAVQYLPGVVKTLATSAVAPTALVAIVLNLVLPEEI